MIQDFAKLISGGYWRSSRQVYITLKNAESSENKPPVCTPVNPLCFKILASRICISKMCDKYCLVTSLPCALVMVVVVGGGRVCWYLWLRVQIVVLFPSPVITQKRIRFLLPNLNVKLIYVRRQIYPIICSMHAKLCQWGDLPESGCIWTWHWQLDSATSCTFFHTRLLKGQIPAISVPPCNLSSSHETIIHVMSGDHCCFELLSLPQLSPTITKIVWKELYSNEYWSAIVIVIVMQSVWPCRDGTGRPASWMHAWCLAEMHLEEHPAACMDHLCTSMQLSHRLRPKCTLLWVS